MLQTCPHIHGNGAQLDLHRQVQRALGDDNGHLHDQMQAAVAGVLRLLYVVHFTDDLERFVARQQTAQIIDVVQIIADDANTCHILNVGKNIVNRYFMTAAFELIHNTIHGFNAVLDMVDGGMVIQAGKFLVQNLHLCHSHL